MTTPARRASRTRRFLLPALALLALAAAGGVAVGYALPVAHHASRTVELPAPPDSVYARVADVAAAPRWRSGVERVEVLAADASGATRWREHSSDGVITYEMVARDAGRRLVSRIADADLPFGGRWTWELERAGTGTRVRLTEDGEVRNPVFRFMSRFVFGHTRTMDAALRDLGASFGARDATPR